MLALIAHQHARTHVRVCVRHMLAMSSSFTEEETPRKRINAARLTLGQACFSNSRVGYVTSAGGYKEDPGSRPVTANSGGSFSSTLPASRQVCVCVCV